MRDEQLGLLERLGLDLDEGARARDEEPEQLVPRPHGQADDLAAALERGAGRELAVPALRAQAERLSPEPATRELTAASDSGYRRSRPA